VFIGNPVPKGQNPNNRESRNKMEDEFMISNLMSENTDLKSRIKELEEKNLELEQIARNSELNFPKGITNMPDPANINEVLQLRDNNIRL